MQRVQTIDVPWIREGGPHLLPFFEPMDVLRFRAVCTEARASVAAWAKEWCLPTGGDGHNAWAFYTSALPHAMDVTLFPNTLTHACRGLLYPDRVCSLNLSHCGMDAVVVQELQPLWQACVGLQRLDVSHNPLHNDGISALLRSLATRRLRVLRATHCRIVSLWSHASLLTVEVLDLAYNSMAPPLPPMPRLEELHAGLLPVGELADVCRRFPRLRLVNDGRLRPDAQIPPQLVAVSLRCMEVPVLHDTSNLRQLHLAWTRMRALEWSRLLVSFAGMRNPTSLRLESTNAPLSALRHFFRALQGPRRCAGFTSLVLIDMQGLTWPVLSSLCVTSMAGIRLRTLGLSYCPDLTLATQTAHDADVLLGILDLEELHRLHLDHHAPRPTSNSFLNRLLRGARRVRHLSVVGRSFELDPDVPPLLDRLETLDNGMAKTSWTPYCLPRLASLDVSFAPLCDLGRLLHNPRLAHLKAPVSLVVGPIQMPPCLYLQTLDLSHTRLSAAARKSLASALRKGRMPVLSSIHTAGSASYQHTWTMDLLKSLDHGWRRCTVYATGLSWSCATKLQRLITLTESMTEGSVSCLHVTVRRALASMLDRQGSKNMRWCVTWTAE